MTERTMLLRCAAASRHVIMGTDFPSARVFDTATSALSAVVELPPRHRSALSSISLTAVALGSLRQPQQQQYNNNNNEEEEEADVTQEADLLETCYAAVGLSNGTVLLHNVTRDVLVDHVLLSNTQRAVLSLSFAGALVVALCADNMVYLVDVTQPQLGLRGRIPVPPGATAVATMMEHVRAGDAKETVLHILVAGPAITVLRVRFPASDSTSVSHAPEVSKLVSFASQGTGVDYCWLGYEASGRPTSTANNDGDRDAAGAATRLVAVTASAQEGMIRIWDVSNEAASATRCRRTLLCGQRMANLCVQTNTTANSMDGGTNGGRAQACVVATTFTGAVLVWNLGPELLPRIAEPLPLTPALALIAESPAGRLLYGFLRPVVMRATRHHAEEGDAAGTRKKKAGSTKDPMRTVALLLLRGRFALPFFEDVQLASLMEAAKGSRHRVGRQLLMSTGLQGITSIPRGTGKDSESVPTQGAMRVLPVPLPDSLSGTSRRPKELQARQPKVKDDADGGDRARSGGDAAAMAFEVADTVWANHRAQVAAKATLTATESFPAVRTYRAASTKDLPIQQLSLEQRLRQLQTEMTTTTIATTTVENEDGAAGHVSTGHTSVANTTSNALGLATVPLYQALHASDTTAVMELLSIAARSHAGMRATVLSLQLPYCLQLLHVLSLRLGILASSGQAVKPENNTSNKQKEEAVRNDTEGETGTDKHEHEESAAAANTGNSNTNTTTTTTAASVHPQAKPSEAVVGGGLAATSLRSPLLEWVDCIIQYRGMELYAAQHEARTDGAGGEAMTSPPKDFIAPILHQYRMTCAQYDKLATMYGRLSIFQGVRASERNVFYQHSRKMQSSNLERGGSAPTAALSGAHGRRQGTGGEGRDWSGASAVLQDDILFPAMFAEVRTRRGGLRAVRVRSRLELLQARREKATRNAALLRRARQMARASAAEDADGGKTTRRKKSRAPDGKAKTKKHKSILDESDEDAEGQLGAGKKGNSMLDEMALAQMGENDGELDLDELAAMQLDSSDEEEDKEGSEEEEEESEEEEGRAGKRTRHAKMLADDDPTAVGYKGEAEEEGGSRASSEAEFSSASDDVLDSDAASEDEEEDDDEDDEEDDEEGTSEADESDEDKRAFGSQDEDEGESDEDDGEDEDGMGEDMQELLAEHETEEDRTEKRKSKRLRVD